jgi:hypothetical protein
MNNKSINNFFTAAITKTKNGKIAWERLSIHTPIFDKISNPHKYDIDRSFYALFEGGIICLLFDNGNETSCWVAPDGDLSLQKIADSDLSSDSVFTALLRLYNLVYEMFPSVESFLNAFIQSENE